MACPEVKDTMGVVGDVLGQDALSLGAVRESIHDAIEFKKFLRTLDPEVLAELDVHVILDNSSTHKTPAIKRWLLAHPRFVLHFTRHRVRG